MIFISLLFSKILQVPVSQKAYTAIGTCSLIGKPKNGFQELSYHSGPCYLAPKGRSLSSTGSSGLITVAEENTFSFSMTEMSSGDNFIQMNSTESISPTEFKIQDCEVKELRILEKTTIVFKVDDNCKAIVIPAGFIQVGNKKNQRFVKLLPKSSEVEDTMEIPSNTRELSSNPIELPSKAIPLRQSNQLVKDPSSRLPQSIQPEESVFSSGNNILTTSDSFSPFSNRITLLEGDFGKHTVRLANTTSEDEIILSTPCGNSKTSMVEDGSFQITTEFPCTIKINGSIEITIK